MNRIRKAWSVLIGRYERSEIRCLRDDISILLLEQVTTQDLIKDFGHNLRVTHQALGRVMALDPERAKAYSGDESDPTRRTISDEIGMKVIERMKAEDLARRHAEGKL